METRPREKLFRSLSLESIVLIKGSESCLGSGGVSIPFFGGRY